MGQVSGAPRQSRAGALGANFNPGHRHFLFRAKCRLFKGQLQPRSHVFSLAGRVGIPAGTAADDQLQSPGFGFVNVVGANLRGAAHHHGVIFFQGCAQLFGGVKLLGHLVAVVFQLLQGGFIHTVGD